MRANSTEDTYPLSPMQQAMLFAYQLDSRSGLYIQQVLCSFHEELNVPAFRRAWEQVLMRHAVLRTSFRWEGTAEPMQDVHTHASLPFEEQDWRSLTSASQQSQFEEFLKLDRKRGFDLTQAPPIRLALFRVGEADYKFVFTYHHIIADGGARYILIDEVFAFYDAYCEGRDLELERPQPYCDHIDWLQQKGSSQSELYWRRLLRGFTAPLALDAIKTECSDDRGEKRGELGIGLAESVTSRLEAVAGQHHLTLNALVQGAWALLLSRYTGEDDVVFGVVRACRKSTVKGADSIVGLFLNTLPVRVRIPSGQNLVSWLEDLREQHVAVRDHEQTPLRQVVAWSDVPRGTPLFDSIVVFDRARLGTRLRKRGGSWLNREFSVREDPAFALVLHAYSEAELLLNILYDRRRFDDATIERMLGHLRTLLEGMAENLDRPLEDLPILTDAERHQLLVEWNDTRTDRPQDNCLHDLFEAQVERTPQAVALAFETGQLTYGDLNCRANQLAHHHLQRLGVGPEVLVGVYMERSLEMVMALYGILKAGGAYVPLDPEYPPDRVAFMLEDARVPVLLTQQRLAASLPEHTAQVICLDSDWGMVAQESTDNPVSEARAENLAYVIYTSGSTGRPKGVMNTHRGICNRLLWMQDAYQLTETDRVLQKTPFAFDVSVWEFFWPHLVGARLVMAQPGGHKDSAYLVRTIVDQGITTLHFVPSMLQLFLEDKDVQQCRSLKRVICSGEALPYELQQRFFERLDAELHNLYGPTEAAVDVSHWQCQRDSDLRTVPIGRPVANTQLYVLDRYMQPVPIGVAGELHIGGVQVARGYLNRPELTGERFIPDPFSDEPEARLYKTGDLVRYLPDGNIEFLGRLDFQVKLRGFRIELGEIEAVLNQHPAIREVVVLLREDAPGDKRLVGYVVPRPEPPLRVSELRDYLQVRLPDYMVPAAFVELEALPLTPNGKVDRRSLPPPHGQRQATEIYVPPRNELEKTIASIWQELLQVDKIGIDDSFFDLGGHSLLIVQAHRRLARMIDSPLSITDMFRFPTIRTLTQHLGRELDGGDQPLGTVFEAPAVDQRASLLQQEVLSVAESSLVRIQKGQSRPPLYILPGNLGNVFTDLKYLVRHLGADQPVFGLQDGLGLPSKVEALAAHCVAEILRVQPTGPYYLAGICSGGTVAFEMAQQFRGQGQRVALLALIEPSSLSLPAARSYSGVIRELWTRATQGAGRHSGTISELDRAERITYLRLRAKVVANIWALRNYYPQSYPGPLDLFLTGDSLKHSPRIDWHKFAADGTRVHEIAGTHRDITGDHATIQDPHMQVLAAKLRACMDRAQ